MRLFIIYFCCFLNIASTIGQNSIESCGTLPGYTELDTALVPWYGNNAVLYEYLNQNADLFKGTNRSQLRNSDPCVAEIQEKFCIPIRFFVWLASDEVANDVVPQSLLQFWVDGVNQGFEANGFNTNFFMYCPVFIVNNDLVDLETDSGTNTLTNGGNSDEFAINVHIVRSAEGWSGLYNPFADNITIVRSASPITLIHEIGHYFGLEHTHRFTENPACCKREPVTRGKKWAEPCLGCVFVGIPIKNRRCSRTGDYLCDTDADPNGTSNICVYNGTQTDGYGEVFHPDTRNYMSYYTGCRDRFSEQQKAIIANGVRDWMYFVDDSIIDPDIYEPDNPDAIVTGTPTLIRIGESQCHSMHSTIVEEACEDEEDWLRIENEDGFLGIYSITVEDVVGEINPVSEVKIWNTNSSGQRTSEITTDFNQVGSVRTWSFNCNSIAPNTTTDFLVEISKFQNPPVDGGIYKVKLDISTTLPVLSGTNQVCKDFTYNLSNIPNGATITWTSSPSLSFIVNSNGTGITITNVNSSNPNYWIKAMVSLGGCTYRVFRKFNSNGGVLPPVQNISWNKSGDDCNPIFYFSIPSVLGATKYTWSCQAPNLNFKGCTSNGTQAKGFAIHLHEGDQFPINISVTASDDCGNISIKTLTINYQVIDCDGGYQGGGGTVMEIQISPNPVNTPQMTLNIIDTLSETAEYQVIITNQFGEMKLVTETTNKENTISTYLLSEGLYYLHVVSELGMSSKSFIVQNE